MKTGRLGTKDSRLGNIILGVCHSTGWLIARFVYPIVVSIEQHLLAILAEEAGLATTIDTNTESVTVDHDGETIVVDDHLLGVNITSQWLDLDIDADADTIDTDEHMITITVGIHAQTTQVDNPDDTNLDADAQMRVEE